MTNAVVTYKYQLADSHNFVWESGKIVLGYLLLF